jgi:hypothetical protein
MSFRWIGRGLTFVFVPGVPEDDNGWYLPILMADGHDDIRLYELVSMDSSVITRPDIV